MGEHPGALSTRDLDAEGNAITGMPAALVCIRKEQPITQSEAPENERTVVKCGQARRARRGLDGARVRSLVAQVLGGFDERVMGPPQRCAHRQRFLSVSVEDEVRRLLDRAKLPKRLAKPVLDACTEEPDSSAFGVSQALTLAAQRQTPEVRHELERLAGLYIASA